MNDFSAYDALTGRAALLVPQNVPEAKRSEFARGFLRYLDEKHPELFALFNGGAVFTRSDRNRLEQQASEFNLLVRKAKGVDDENA